MIPFIPVLFLLLVILGCALYALVSEYLENRNIQSQGWKRPNKSLLVWEKSCDKGTFQVVKKSNHFLILVNGTAIRRVDCECNQSALFEADQMIRF